jgi:hypothetical protein
MVNSALLADPNIDRSKPIQHRITIMPAGLTDLHGRIASGRLILPGPPAAAYQLDREQLTKAISLLLPYPFQVTLDDVQIFDGPVVSATVHPTFALPGLSQFRSVRVTISQNGLVVSDSPAGTTLQSAVAGRIAEALRSSEISLGPQAEAEPRCTGERGRM